MRIKILLFTILLMFGVAACDNNGGNKGPLCTPEEYREILANAECLAEEMLVACDRNIGCRGFDPSFQTFLLNDCNFIDCETLSCSALFIEGIPEPGFLTELTFNEIIGYPVGIYQVNNLEGEFTCDVFTVE